MTAQGRNPRSQKTPPASPISRRTILIGSGSLVILGAFAATSRCTNRVDPPSDLRDRWTQIITGRGQLRRGDERIRKHLDELDASVSSSMKAIERATSTATVFAHYPLDARDSHSLSGTAITLATMARAWATPRLSSTHDPTLLQAIEDGTRRLLRAGFLPGNEPYGNWYDWEIGAPRPLADLACILRDDLAGDLVSDITQAIRYFIPDPRRSAINGSLSTAANRVNTTRAALIGAIVEQDQERAKFCMNALREAWEPTRTGDGFHRDGGFIQHETVPYTGSYGVTAIQDLACILELVNDTKLSVNNLSPILDIVERNYFTVIVNGHMMDSVRGRAVSRVRSNGSVIGQQTVGPIARIAKLAPSGRGDSWRSLIHQWAQDNTTVDLLFGSDLSDAIVLEDATNANTSAAAPEISRYVPSMDRLIHRAGSWTATFAMCSSRVSAYEFSSKENYWASRTGEFMRYVYPDGDPTAYENGFWSTLDYSCPPGTTTRRTQLERGVTRPNGSKLTLGEWTGGLTNGEYSIAAMHQVGLDSDMPRCRKFAVATPDALIEAVSQVPQETPPVTTAIENRMIPPGSAARLAVEGSEVRAKRTFNRPAWAHLESVGGYVFLTQAPLTAQVSTRLGSDLEVQRDESEIVPAHRISREWATLSLQHTKAPTGDAWIVIPGASEQQTTEIAHSIGSKKPFALIARNDKTAQVVHTGSSVAAAAVWAPTTIDAGAGIRLDCQAPLVVLVRHIEAGLEILLSEPTHERKSVRISVSGAWGLEKPVDGVSFTGSGDWTRLEMRTEDLVGAPVRFRLQPA